MKKLKKFVYRMYFDKRTGNIIGINTQQFKKKCAYKEQCPVPDIQAFVLSDLDRKLPPLLGQVPKSVIEVEAHLEVFEK